MKNADPTLTVPFLLIAKRLWRFLRSVRLALVLILAIAAVSLAGALEKLMQQYFVSPVPGSVIGAADVLPYRIDHLTGSTPGYPYPLPLHRLISSLVVTALILATIPVPLPSSHPISGGV